MTRFIPWDFWLWSLAVVAVILNAALGSYNIDGMAETHRRVAHTRAVQMEFAALLSDMKDAETGHRGFLLTGDATYLDPFLLAETSHPARLERLAALTADTAEHRERLNGLGEAIRAKFQEMKRTILVRERSGLEVVARAITDGRGKVLMDRIRGLSAEALEAEEAQLELRTGQARDQIALARVATFASAGLAIAIILAAAVLIRSELRRRLAVNQALVEAKEQLEISFDAVRESETRFRDLADHFERLVQERTAELNEQARHLQASNKELETFAYIASHDLQEPLRKIQAFGDRLLKKHRDKLDEDGRDSLGRMLDSAGRMRRLIEDLLAYSRIGTAARPPAPVKLNAVLSDVVNIFEVRLEQTGGRIAVGPLPVVNGDESQLRQLFQNLIGNAIKFAKADRPPLVQIDAVEFRDLPADADPPRVDGPGWRIAVRDNGIGFEQQYADRIFELFQRLHGRHEYEGTGLGLAICKKITRQHGILLRVRSTPGIGTTFFLDWPLGAREQPNALAQTGDDSGSR